MATSVIEQITQIPILKALDPQELDIVGKQMKATKLKKGKILFNEGEQGEGLYFIVDGRLDILKRTVSESYVFLNSIDKGRSIGEMAIIDKLPRSATVRAFTDVKLLVLTQEGFESLLEEHPRIGIKILKGIARLLSLNLRKTSGRLAEYMLPLT